jgi:hypothetical protein
VKEFEIEGRTIVYCEPCDQWFEIAADGEAVTIEGNELTYLTVGGPPPEPEGPVPPEPEGPIPPEPEPPIPAEPEPPIPAEPTGQKSKGISFHIDFEDD